MITLRIMLLELRRMVASPRWAIVGAVCLLAAWLAESSVRVATVNSHLSAHAEDVYLAAVNNLVLVGCLVLPAFALAVAGSLAADRSSGFVALVLGRCGSRGRIWAAKVVAIVCGAALTQVLLVWASYAMASFAGYASTRMPSALALLPASETSMSLFAPALAGDDQLARVVVAATFLTWSFSAVGVATLAESERWPHELLPPALLIGVVFFDWLIARFSHLGFYERVSLSIRLLESSHMPTMPGSISWASSVAYFAAVMALAAAGGWWLLERYDV